MNELERETKILDTINGLQHDVGCGLRPTETDMITYNFMTGENTSNMVALESLSSKFKEAGDATFRKIVEIIKRIIKWVVDGITKLVNLFRNTKTKEDLNKATSNLKGTKPLPKVKDVVKKAEKDLTTKPMKEENIKPLARVKAVKKAIKAKSGYKVKSYPNFFSLRTLNANNARTIDGKKITSKDMFIFANTCGNNVLGVKQVNDNARKYTLVILKQIQTYLKKDAFDKVFEGSGPADLEKSSNSLVNDIYGNISLNVVSAYNIGNSNLVTKYTNSDVIPPILGGMEARLITVAFSNMEKAIGDIKKSNEKYTNAIKLTTNLVTGIKPTTSPKSEYLRSVLAKLAKVTQEVGVITQGLSKGILEGSNAVIQSAKYQNNLKKPQKGNKT